MPENIYWSPKAIDHLRGIRDYIAKDSNIYAKNVVSQIIQKIEIIGKSSLSDKIEIAAIFHTAQILKDLD